MKIMKLNHGFTSAMIMLVLSSALNGQPWFQKGKGCDSIITEDGEEFEIHSEKGIGNAVILPARNYIGSIRISFHLAGMEELTIRTGSGNYKVSVSSSEGLISAWYIKDGREIKLSDDIFETEVLRSGSGKNIYKICISAVIVSKSEKIELYWIDFYRN